MKPKLIRLSFLFFSVLIMSLLPSGVLHADPPESGMGHSRSSKKGVGIGDPISANSGAHHFDLPLFNLGGPIPVTYSLHYQLDDFVGFSDVNRNIISNLFIYIEQYPHDITGDPLSIVHFGNGEVIAFTYNDETDVWELDASSQVRYVLKETENTMFFLDPINNLVYIFGRIGYDEFWKVIYIMDRNGNRLDFDQVSQNELASVTDGLGRTLTFTYGVQIGTTFYSWLINNVHDQCGRTVTFNYDEHASDFNNDLVLRSVTDTMGGNIVFNYTPVDLGWGDLPAIRSVDRPRGNTPYIQDIDYIELNGKEWARVTAQTDAYGNTLNLSYNPGTNEVTETRPDASTVVYEHYYNDGLPQTITDPTGKSTNVTQTGNEQIATITDRMGDTTSIVYHEPTGRIASYTDAAGYTTTYTYTAEEQNFTNPDNAETVTFTFYNQTRIDYADGSHEEFTYDPAHHGNVLSHTDRAGKVWSFTYNGRGQALTETNPLGGTITNTYNSDGTLASKNDPEIGLTSYQYDACKRLNRITHCDETFIQNTYNAYDQVTSITDERGNTFSYNYDANGNLESIVDPKGNSTQYAYDLMDRLTTITGRRGQVSNTTFDAMGRRASDTDPGGVVTTYEYDSHGWRTRVTFGGRTWQTGYDDEGVVNSTKTPLDLTTTYQTNKQGKVTRITDPLGNQVELTRDAHQRVTAVTDALGHTTNFSYNEWDMLDSVSMPGIGTAHYQRNDLGLLTCITDLNGNDWNFGYSNMGRLISSTDPLGNIWSFGHNCRGFVDQITFPDGEIVTLRYDDAGNQIQSIYSDGPNLNFTYDDELNRLTGGDNIGLTRDEEGNILATYNRGTGFKATFDNSGWVESASYCEEAFNVTYTYDSTSGLLTEVHDDLTGTTLNFSYDNDMRLTGITRPNSVNTLFTWDDASRLVRIRHGGISDIHYTRDAAGRITGIDMNVPLDPADLLSSGDETFAYDAADQVSSTGYAYDQRGQRTSDPTHNYTWDGAGRLLSVGMLLTKDMLGLLYNDLGDVINWTEDNQTVCYYYNYAIRLHPIMAERLGLSGSWLRYYVYTPQGRLLYMIDAQDSNKVYYYHFDNIGSTLFLTDDTGSVTDSYAYDPYGRLIGHNGTNPQRFTFVGEMGVRQEGADGDLYHMRSRHYDAVTAAFLTRDPVWPTLADINSLNPYQYALRNPLTGIDPTGRQSPTSEAIQNMADSGNTSSVSNRASTDYVKIPANFFDWLANAVNKLSDIPTGLNPAGADSFSIALKAISGWAQIGVLATEGNAAYVKEYGKTGFGGYLYVNTPHNAQMIKGDNQSLNPFVHISSAGGKIIGSLLYDNHREWGKAMKNAVVGAVVNYAKAVGGAIDFIGRSLAEAGYGGETWKAAIENDMSPATPVNSGCYSDKPDGDYHVTPYSNVGGYHVHNHAQYFY